MAANLTLTQVILNEWNKTEFPYSSWKCIHHLFEEQVLAQPNHTALIFNDQKETYLDLNNKANQLARILQTYNIEPNSFIGIHLKRSPEQIICLLAILKLGAAYVPLNISDPDHRIQEIVESADIKVVITNSGNTKELPNDVLQLHIEELINKLSLFETSNILVEKQSDEPAYIIFTSGSTGKPKGVQVVHKTVINLIEWVNSTFKVDYNDKLLWTTNLSFDLSVYDIFGILAAGATIRILSDEERFNPELQLNIMLNEGITFWDSAPQSLQQITPFLKNITDIERVQKLRLVFLSGDWVPLKLPGEIKQTFSNVTFVALGGATEATIWSNYFVVDNINPSWKSIPYGKPIQNAKYYVLDNNLNHCDINEPGDLYIGGDCLAVGYYKDEQLTAKKFISDPFNDGGTLYLTGDKAQWMPDGNIEFLGREDDQIKVRGYRVEIGEIKSATLQINNIKDAVIIADKSDKFNTKVILFITSYNNENIDLNDIKDNLRQSLPEYMIPAYIISVPQIPITRNGKVNSAELFEIYQQNILGTNILDNQNLSAVQQKLAKIWADVLHTNSFNILDSFYDIGGHSLLAMQVINHIREEFNLNIPYRDFDQNHSINALAVYLENKSQSGTQIELKHMQDVTNLPLSSSQKRIWFFSILNKKNPCYNIPLTYRLTGEVDLNIFEKCTEILFDRHSILFSVFKQKNGLPYCEISENRNIHILHEDLSSLSVTDKEQKTNEIISEESRVPFDLENDQLFRLMLIKLSNEEYYFHATFHHLIFDGWSWGIFIEELGKIYNSLIKGEPLSLKPLNYQQYDFAAFQENNENNEDELKTFWSNSLKGVPSITRFPYDFARHEQPSGFGEREYMRFSNEQTDKLKIFSKQNNTTLYTTVLAAFGVLINQYSAEDDICLGTLVANRPFTELENVLGMFVNTLALRLQFKENITFTDFVKEVKDLSISAIAHQDLSFEKIIEVVKPERIHNVNPLFQIAFAWQDNLGVPIKLGNIDGERITEKKGVSPFDLTFYMWENGSFVEGEIEYNIDILSKGTISRLKENFLTLINSILNNFSSPLSTLSIISKEEENLLAQFNKTDAFYQKDISLIHKFQEMVLLCPNKFAVICGEETLTYNELNQKSNQVASYLVNLNVKSNDIVGVSVDRSIQMLISVLGVLKAGAAYLPMDPAFPEDRTKYMFDDADAKVLITQKSLLTRFSDVKTDILLIDDDWQNIEKQSKDDINKITDNQSIAYILYTSGSTGKPKGVKVHHQAVSNFLNSMTKCPGLTSEDNLLAVTTPSFDISVLELYLPLINGASIVLAKTGEIIDGQQLINLIEKFDITILQATPVTWTLLLRNGWKGKSNIKALCGGEAISPNLASELLPNVKELWNMYGPTETTVWSTLYQIVNPKPPILVGKPIDNTQIYFLNKNNQLAPVGTIGELCIGGDGVSKGYHNREDLNQEKFITGPYGDRIYKTGDAGHFLLDGNIELMGRMDNQIKLRGFRIEPGEIEAVLCQIEGIKEAVVKVHQFSEIDQRLVAFLNVSEGFAQNNDSISKNISQKLPPYMVPTDYALLNEFPRTPNGKIDKKLLVYTQVDSGNTSLVKPQNEIQQKLFDVWVEVLNKSDFGINDNYFYIGGHSLLSVLLVSKIELAFGIKLDLRNFFDSPTIRDLALLVELKLAKNPSSTFAVTSDSEINTLILELNKKKIKLLVTTGKLTYSSNQSNLTPDLIEKIEKHSQELIKYFWPKSFNLMPISTQGNKIPLILVHCEHANYFLSEELKDYPLYGFFHLGSDGKKVKIKTTEDYAAFYLKQLKEIVPNGPYYLGGFSYGGNLAYEMARQLINNGENVPIVFLIDCAHQVIEFENGETSEKETSVDFSDFIITQYYRVYHKSRRMLWNLSFFFGIVLPPKYRKKYIQDKYNLLRRNCKTREKLNSELVFFIASENKNGHSYLGWDGLFDQKSIYDIEGDHETIMTNESSINVLKQAFRKHLSKYQ